MSHEEFLRNSFVAGKLAHAYIFSGNDLAAKERALRTFFAAVAGKDRAKKLKEDFWHADVLFVSGGQENEIGIAHMRRLKDAMALGAWQLPLKIAIIRNADAMTAEAQAAFLKLMEEPRGERVFFLLSAHSARLLDTIRSRAQELRFYEFLENKNADGTVVQNLRNSSLAHRFEYAKAMGEDREKTSTAMKDITSGVREFLLDALPKGNRDLGYWRGIMKIITETQKALQDTEVNRRIVLERILLEL